jgi:basic amino acid/polyamine antiporter, APA family
VIPKPIPTASMQPLAPAEVTRGEPDPAATSLARKLGLFDMTMLVMGSVIGAGVFLTPGVVAGLVHVPVLVLAAWVLGGLVSMAGCLVYAELTRRRPHVGGQYAFLREAYHPAVAFVYGWSLLWIIQSGGMAFVALVFAQYLSPLLHLAVSDKLVAALAIVMLTAVNCAGVRAGSTTQNIFMILKILAIMMLVLCGLWVAGVPFTQPAAAPTQNTWQTGTLFAAAMVQVFFTYGGWHTTTFMAGEVCEPRRTLPRGLILGVSGVIVLYVAVNYVYLHVLGVDGLANSKSPAADVMVKAVDQTGAVLISLGIAISAIGFLSQAMLTSPRVYYAMAQDGLFLKAVAWVHPRSRAPIVAVLLQGLFALVIAVSGTVAQIVNYVMVVEMTFWVLTSLSLFIFRRRDAAAGANLQSSMLGHPVTTLLFAGVNVAVILNLCYDSPVNSAVGIGIALVGVPVYFGWRWLTSRQPS